MFELSQNYLLSINNISIDNIRFAQSKLRLSIVQPSLKSQNNAHVAIESIKFDEGTEYRRNVVIVYETDWKYGN